jgi:pimeloyl-ACP methyl ester carboxylesterase
MDLIVNAEKIFAYSNGRDFVPEKPTIVFVHGAGMDHSVWTLQARYFAHHGANAVAIDLPGHGKSGGQPLPSIEAMGNWVAAVIETLETKKAVLVGHSMGALICLQAAAAHPGVVEQVALLGASPAMPVHPALLEAAAANQPLAGELVSSWGHGPAGHIGGNRAPGGWLMGHALKLLERAPKNVLHNDLAACNAYQNGMAAAESVQCPTLLISGSEDRMTPARESIKLAAVMAKAELVEIHGSGHLMLVEKPDETLDALIAWRQRLA